MAGQERLLSEKKQDITLIYMFYTFDKMPSKIICKQQDVFYHLIN